MKSKAPAVYPRFDPNLKYSVGVVPNAFLNMEMNALGVEYPASKAA